MESRTVTIVVDAPVTRVYPYIANIENLPGWATEFARELKVVNGRHKVVNGLGEFFFEIRADAATGVIDMLVGPTPDELAIFPTRVVDVGDGRSAFSFTMFRWPGQPEDLFESQYDSLVRELHNIEGEFGAG